MNAMHKTVSIYLRAHLRGIKDNLKHYLHEGHFFNGNVLICGFEVEFEKLFVIYSKGFF